MQLAEQLYMPAYIHTLLIIPAACLPGTFSCKISPMVFAVYLALHPADDIQVSKGPGFVAVLFKPFDLL